MPWLSAKRHTVARQAPPLWPRTAECPKKDTLFRAFRVKPCSGCSRGLFGDRCASAVANLVALGVDIVQGEGPLKWNLPRHRRECESSNKECLAYEVLVKSDRTHSLLDLRSIRAPVVSHMTCLIETQSQCDLLQNARGFTIVNCNSCCSLDRKLPQFGVFRCCCSDPLTCSLLLVHFLIPR